jgi:tape measure domain-containing protein
VAKGDLQYNVAFDVDLAEIQRLQRALATGGVEAAREFNKALGGAVTKQVVFETRTDASGAKRLVAVEKERLSVADAYINKINQIEKLQAGSVTSLRQQVNQAKQARDEITKYVQTVGALGGKVNSINTQWAIQNSKVKDLQRSLDLAGASGFWERAKVGLNAQGVVNFANGLTQVTTSLQSASIIIGQVVGSVNNLVNALGALQGFKLAFEAVGQGAGGAGLALAESSRIALGLGVDLKTVRNSFQQLTPVILNSGGTIGDVSNVVEALSSRFAAFGIAGDRARRVTNGIIQAFAKGKLQAEELTQQISEADPAFKTDFAGALKISVAQLEELVKAGDITGKVLLETIPKLGKTALLFGRLGTSAVDAADSLATSGTTVDQVRAKLQTISQLSLERFAKSIEPLLFSFVRLGAVITDSIDRISRLEGIKSIGNILGNVSTSLGSIAEAGLAFAETGLQIISVLARLSDFLLSIPGVTQVVALAIAAKLIAPLASLKAAFGKSITSATAWGQAIRSVTTFSGLSETLKGLGRSSVTASAQIEQLGKQKQTLGERATKAQGAIDRLQSKIKGYQTVIAGQKALPDFASSRTSQATVDRYTYKLGKATIGLEKLRNGLESINKEQTSTSARLTDLTNKKGLATKAAGLFQKTLVGVGGAGKALLNTLGPIGVALAVAATLTSAYRTANESSNAILEQSKQRVDALKASLTELGGSAADQQSSITGLTLVWQKFSFIVSDLIDTIKRPFEGAADGAGKAGKTTNSFLDTMGRLVQAFLIGGVAGATLFGWTGIGAVPAALIGAVTASVIALVAGSDDAGVKQRQLIKDVDATKEAIIAQSNAAGALVSGLKPLDGKSVDIDFTRSLAGFRQAETALGLVKKDIEALNNQKIILKANAAELKKPSEALVSGFNKVETAFAKVQALKDQIVEVGGWENAPRALQKGLKEAEAEAGKLQQGFREQFGPDAAENHKEYLELQSAIKIVNDRLYESEAAYKRNLKIQDDYARSNGLLTSEQKKVTDTVSGLNEKLKELQSTLQNDLNPNATPEKWKAISREIADTTVKLNALEDAAVSSINNELIYTIKTKIQTGEIANSVANVQRLVQALEQRATVLDINSPALFGVLQDLEEARSKTDELNGRQASIRVEILEARGANSTVGTLNEIGRYIDALEQRRVNIPIGSAEIDGIIEKQNEAKLLQDAGSKSSGELRRFIETEALNERLRGIQAAQQKEAEASEARRRGLQDELTRVKGISDARLEGLRAATPAERRLAEIQKGKLQETARSGATEEERVAAQAQLERLDREKQIAAEQKRAKEEQAALEKKLKLEAENARVAEKQFREEQQAVQQKLLELQKEEIEARIKAAKEVLKARENDKTAAEGTAKAQETGAGYAEETKKSLELGRIEADGISKAILSLDGKTVTVNIKTVGLPGLWTGGPTQAGQTYQVNELGQEGFLSAGGSLRPISKPKNALWRAPSSGTVIPAHIWSGLDIPTGGVTTNARPMAAGSGGNGLQRVVRAIQSSLAQPRESGQAMYELTAVQARQSIEIGKLSRAVNKLANKDQSVNVSVRNNDATAYLGALNSRI